MNEGVLTIAYLVAGVCFIRSLGGLSKQETAPKGNLFGIVGMGIAVAATLFHARVMSFELVLASALLGGGIGAVLAKRVVMTAMPELVALLHSFVGLAAVLVGISTYLAPGSTLVGVAHAIHLGEIWIGVAVGAVTFTGSVIAWAKLRGSIGGKPLLLPGRHALNLVIALAIGALAIPFAHAATSGDGLVPLVGMTVLASLLGMHLVMAIGGADMPVVVSLLNSYSGWAAAAAGFMLANDLLIVTGALVGSSGAILSIIMCRAMNRSIWNVVFGGFGASEGAAATGTPSQILGSITETSVDELASTLAGSKRVVIVPGYGMAVARAQHAVYEMTKLLRGKSVDVTFAIHPVAGRLPGHMNVLLAEAGVPYDIVHEMEEVNPELPHTDVVLVIGANDIVNPGALDDATSPIYGMPVIEAWKAKVVVVFKRGMAAGYAGVENPLFFHDNTRMLFGDAKKTMDALVEGLRR